MSTQTWTDEDDRAMAEFVAWNRHVEAAIQAAMSNERGAVKCAVTKEEHRTPRQAIAAAHLLLVFLLAVTGITVAVIAAVAYAGWVGAGVVAGVVGLALLIRYAVKDVTP